jgi:hypothetical protein
MHITHTVAMRAVLVAALIAAGCGPTAPTSLPPTTLTLALQSAAWETIADPSPYPLANSGSNALVFDFPETGSMHYLYTASPRPDIRGTVEVSVRVATTGPVVFRSLEPPSASCTIPLSVRPFFWANQNGNGEFDRWWSNPRAFTLAAGAATISVPLTPALWSSVNGKFGNADSFANFGFERAILNVSRLGLTFGGGCSFGHGINIQGGRAEFTLAGYGIR